ncbi:MAG: hypothetical protein U5N26_12585 [Candidatus Marinimicrobia bacterium]|nr:hypothetical protein [Candidatus Neomarinimicrobiota bacterium]
MPSRISTGPQDLVHVFLQKAGYLRICQQSGGDAGTQYNIDQRPSQRIQHTGNQYVVFPSGLAGNKSDRRNVRSQRAGTDGCQNTQPEQR